MVFFFYKFGKFLGDLDRVKVSQSKIPKFIKTADIVSLVALYEKFSIGDTRGLVCTQFMVVLNILLGDDFKKCKGVMSQNCK